MHRAFQLRIADVSRLARLASLGSLGGSGCFGVNAALPTFPTKMSPQTSKAPLGAGLTQTGTYSAFDVYGLNFSDWKGIIYIYTWFPQIAWKTLEDAVEDVVEDVRIPE